MIFCSQKHNQCFNFYFQLRPLSRTSDFYIQMLLYHLDIWEITNSPSPNLDPWWFPPPQICSLCSLTFLVPINSIFFRQWFSNSRIHQRHLEGLWKIPDCRGLSLQSFWFSRCGVESKTAFLASSLMILLLLVWWPHFTNHCALELSLTFTPNPLGKVGFICKVCRIWPQSSPNHHHVTCILAIVS